MTATYSPEECAFTPVRAETSFGPLFIDVTSRGCVVATFGSNAKGGTEFVVDGTKYHGAVFFGLHEKITFKDFRLHKDSAGDSDYIVRGNTEIMQFVALTGVELLTALHQWRTHRTGWSCPTAMAKHRPVYPEAVPFKTADGTFCIRLNNPDLVSVICGPDTGWLDMDGQKYYLEATFRRSGSGNVWNLNLYEVYHHHPGNGDEIGPLVHYPDLKARAEIMARRAVRHFSIERQDVIAAVRVAFMNAALTTIQANIKNLKKSLRAEEQRLKLAAKELATELKKQDLILKQMKTARKKVASGKSSARRR